ncbi:hypothetical protein [Aliikangiella coralliicola]|uniref:Glycoside hydrolase family 5 domain-containing protein n=1 Tax=Aliikangiella coralliicola TaxID=2592383 RepID=A0A545UH69_9GAMM|nr:hypothetical protein [Aliikangiella coralliicola]TQV88817.1 hypothetical protein FLL46_04605 [Aliikangiella coralliicola]
MTSKTDPRLALSPIQGVCYQPTPSDDTPVPLPKYFDSDYYNSDFSLLWGTSARGRNDLNNLSTNLGVNFVHLYNWSVPPAPGSTPGDYQRDHVPFLNACENEGIKVFVPISNYFLEQINQGNTQVKSQIKSMVTEVYAAGASTKPNGAAIWGIGNEYDLATSFTAADVATAISYLLDAEKGLGVPSSNLLPITSPVSFAVHSIPNAPAISALQTLQQAFTAAGLTSTWDDRFIASVNSFNTGSFLKNYVDTTFPQYFPDLPFFFSEMGINLVPNGYPSTEKDQADYVADQLKNTAPSGNFLGTCVFQFLNQSAVKTGTEATFGAYKYSGNISEYGAIPAGYVPGGGEQYPVDSLTAKDMVASITQAYK